MSRFPGAPRGRLPLLEEEGQVDLRYVEALARQDFEAVGFIPRVRLEEYAARGQILMAQENDEPAGFLVFGSGWPVLRIYQALIQYDARRREQGAALVDRLMRQAEKRQAQIVSLWCADDLPANEFWRAMGFQMIGSRRGGDARGRLHNRWVRSVAPDLALADFSVGAYGPAIIHKAGGRNSPRVIVPDNLELWS